MGQIGLKRIMETRRGWLWATVGYRDGIAHEKAGELLRRYRRAPGLVVMVSGGPGAEESISGNGLGWPGP
jgi:hypothetical protein